MIKFINLIYRLFHSFRKFTNYIGVNNNGSTGENRVVYCFEPENQFTVEHNNSTVS